MAVDPRKSVLNLVILPVRVGLGNRRKDVAGSPADRCDIVSLLAGLAVGAEDRTARSSGWHRDLSAALNRDILQGERQVHHEAQVEWARSENWRFVL